MKEIAEALKSITDATGGGLERDLLHVGDLLQAEIFPQAELGGGALYDLGVYTIALAHALLGVPTDVTASGSIRDDSVDLHEAYTLAYRDSGALAQLTNSLTAFIPPAAWVGGTKGAIVFGEPLFAPRSLRIVTGQPPAPPTVEVLEFDQDG